MEVFATAVVFLELNGYRFEADEASGHPHSRLRRGRAEGKRVRALAEVQLEPDAKDLSH
jgi:hypothetical protein